MVLYVHAPPSGSPALTTSSVEDGFCRAASGLARFTTTSFLNPPSSFLSHDGFLIAGGASCASGLVFWLLLLLLLVDQVLIHLILPPLLLLLLLMLIH